MFKRCGVALAALACSTLSSAEVHFIRANPNVESNDLRISTNVSTIDLSTSFRVTDSPAREANIDLSSTGVTAGSYTNSNVTVDAQGRITSASNGSAGSGGGTALRVEDGGSAIVTTSTMDFTGTQFDVTNNGSEALISLVSSSVTLLGPSIALGSETTGVYVASINATAPITVTANGTAGSTPTLALTQNAGTDITADLEEETHASEHQDGGADEIAVTGLSGQLADPQEIRFSTNGTFVSVSTGANFIPGTQVTLSGVETGNRFDLTITNGYGATVDDTELTAEDFGDFTCTGLEDGCTVDADAIALGTDSTGVYVASITVGASLLVTGTNNAETAAPILNVNPSSATLQGAAIGGQNISVTNAAGSHTIALTGTVPAGNLVSTVAYTNEANTFSKTQTLSGGFSSSTGALTALGPGPLKLAAGTSTFYISQISPSTDVAAGILPGTVIASSVAARNITAGQMANADHGDVSWSAGVATVDNVAAANVAAGTMGTSVLVSSFVGSGATAGTYGSATQVSSITINAQGMVTRATNLAISISTTGMNASGTASATTFLRGDNSWASPAGSGDAILAATQTFSGQDTFTNAVTISTSIVSVKSIFWSDGTVQVSSPSAGGGSGDVTDVFNCASGDCSSVSMTDGDLLDASRLTPSATTEGIIITTGTDCTSMTGRGQLCYDTDDYTISVGTGGVTKRIGKIIKEFKPEEAQFLTTSFPQVLASTFTNFATSGLAYDAATSTENANWKFAANDYIQGNITVTIYWYAATATSGDVVWSGHIAAVTPNVDTEDILQTTAAGTYETVTDTHLGTTARRLHSIDLTITNLDSIAAGDLVWLQIGRNGATAADTMTGDAVLVYATLSY